MNNQKAKKNEIEISVLGGGIAGITTAFYLGDKGYKVNLIDPHINSKINNFNPQNGTQAALGVLMGNSNKKTKGRAFLLCNKSMRLWKEWLLKLDYQNSSIELNTPLIKLASSEKEYQSMIEISNNKKNFGIEILDQISIQYWSSIFETKLIGGLISHNDGRLNPVKLLKLLKNSLDKLNINQIKDTVINIKKNLTSFNKKWTIYTEKNQCLHQDYIIICTALNTEKLLNPLGHKILLEPILGQVFELKLESQIMNWNQWPAVLNYQSINFIKNNSNHMLMGATLEKGLKANAIDKDRLLNMNNSAPKWIKKAIVNHEWSGIRARPKNEPAPLLKELESGLLINTGHYRNGILLAPACAEWVGLKIENEQI